MVTLPAATPVTAPVVGFTVAMEVLLEVQTPPLTLLVRVSLDATQIPLTPPLMMPGEGNGLMVTNAMLEVSVPQTPLTTTV